MKNFHIGFNANEENIYLNPDIRTKTHMHVIGSTGAGKSKFLEWMIRGDIKNGSGVCLIDPHGTPYNDVLKWCAYHNIGVWDDREIILLNPSKGDYVIGFNPFLKTEYDVSVQVDSMITATIRAWDMANTDQTPTLERWLRCIYQVLIEKQASVVASKSLIDYQKSEVRRYLTSNLSEPLIESEWQQLDGLKSTRQFREEMQSTKNRLMRFLCHPQICRFMGMQSLNINLREIMDEGKILLVNLSDSSHLSPDNARVFGALLINELCQQAKLREKDEYNRDPKPFYVYMDEFQNFVSLDIASGLDQLRKFGLHFILAHQRFGQLGDLDSDIVDAILTNAKIRAVFGGLPRKYAKLMVEEMFTNLDLKQIKKAIYQTKFYPVYTRDQVFSSAYNSTKGRSSLSSLSTGSSTHFTAAGEGWFDIPFDIPQEIGTTEFDGSGSGSGEFGAEGKVSATIDIPIFHPVPFKELSSEEYWKLEELIWQLSDALKKQLLRHCFIEMPNQETQPMLVPFVQEYRVFPEDLVEYQETLYQKANALPKEQTDMLLEQEKERLEKETEKFLLELEPDTVKAPKKTSSKAKSTKAPQRPKLAKV